MRRELILIAFVISMLLATAACSGTESDDPDAGPVEVSGPALVMFYTDN